MTKIQVIKTINERIDTLIIEGGINTEEYKRLCALHKTLVFAK
jgi:hypothetical protein